MARPEAIASRVRTLLGSGTLEHTADGQLRAVPEHTDALALLCGVAADEHWSLRVEGMGTWLPGDAPADLVVSTRALDRVLSVAPADLVATVQAGVPLDALRRRLASDGLWLALDAPGRPDRSIGSIVSTGTAGALRLGYGPVRDHVLGCTLVTGEGRIVRPGGRVVKNVAGYDLTRLATGGFGAFGILTELHLRLRALPPGTLTVIARGPRDQLTSTARDLDAAHLDAQALELCSPAAAAEAQWVLAARFIGTELGVIAEGSRLQELTDLDWRAVDPDRATQFWRTLDLAPLGGEVTLRFGVLRDGIDDLLDVLGEVVGEGIVTAGAMSGAVRWSGRATAAQVTALRRTLMPREIACTIERAPWAVRAEAGTFGSFGDGVGPLVARLRESFDPAGIFRSSLGGPT